MKLYHGTSAEAAQKIMTEGLLPRGKRRGNWKHTVDSNPDFVYLTDSYAIYFAGCCGKKEHAVVEVDVSPLDLYPDEDWLEQTSRMGGPIPTTWSMERRTKWYRKRLQEFGVYHEKSLAGLGTCTHHGPIPPSKITRVAHFDNDAYVRMIMTMGVDPTITLMNYAILGQKYRDSVQWLFGDRETVRDIGRESAHPRDGIRVETVKK